ncbi:MAG: rpsF [Solirubrobacterales bacterium]|nr:rpsF [Solirubrobacterales bacterium]
MAKHNPTYDLMLLLDPAIEPEARTKILSDATALITQHGEVVGSYDWGTRQTTYEVAKNKKEAEYDLIQFHGTPELLAALNRTLRITDGVLRFRIIKLAPGVGTPPDLKATPAMIPTAAPDEERQVAL